MSKEWREVTLGQVIKEGNGSIQTGPFGSQLHASDYVTQGIPCIMPANITDTGLNLEGIAYISEDDAFRLSRHIVKKGDIVYSRRGDVTKKLLIRDAYDGMFCGTGCLLIRPGVNIDSTFLNYHLSTPWNRRYIVQHAIGATMPNLNTGILSDIPLTLPPLPEQKAIAHILGSLDDKIELNRQMNKTLEEMAQALFQSWFVDFDPVLDNALAQGREIPEELQQKAERRKAVAANPAYAHLPEDLKALFPSSFVYSEQLGKWVPEGWEVNSLGNEVNLIGGGTPKTSIEEYWSGDIPWFSVVDAPSDSDVFTINTEKKITQLGLENSSAKILREGTTIISARGTVGKCALVGVPMAMNQSCYGVQGVRQNTDFFTYLLLRKSVSDLQSRSHGSVFDTITRDTFQTINVVLPFDGDVLLKFHSLVENGFERIKQNLIQNQSLTSLRDTLLPQLISGKLSVQEAKALCQD